MILIEPKNNTYRIKRKFAFYKKRHYIFVQGQWLFAKLILQQYFVIEVFGRANEYDAYNRPMCGWLAKTGSFSKKEDAWLTLQDILDTDKTATLYK